MAFIVADRVRDTATTTGTGVFTVSGLAPSTYRTLSAVCAVNDTLPYFIQNQSANEFEVGIGTYSASNQLTRTAVNVLSGSSGLGTLVSFSAGTKDVVLGIPARNAYARELLQGSRSYFVNGSTGSDSNNGLTSGTAFLTIQHAYDVIASTLDVAGFTVTVNVADATYAPASNTQVLIINTAWVGAGSLAFVGNTTTPANCVLSSTSADCIVINTPILGNLTFGGFKLTTTTGGSCLALGFPSNVQFNGKMEFGASALFHISSTNGGLFNTFANPYTISGGAVFHYNATDGTIVVNSSTVTLTGTPSFTIFALASRLGFLDVESVTYSGSATGTRYEADNNAVIYGTGGGANYFPGNAAGSTATGGQYS